MAFTTSLADASRREAADSGHAFCLPLESIGFSGELLRLGENGDEDAASSGPLPSGFLSIFKVLREVEVRWGERRRAGPRHMQGTRRSYLGG